MLEYHRELGMAVAGATVLLRDRAPLERELLAHLTPAGRVVSGRVRHQAPPLGHRRALGQEAAHAARQLLSFRRHPHAHAPGSFGRPSTRSAMMLRWISAVPPQIVCVPVCTKACSPAARWEASPVTAAPGPRM